MSTTLTETDRHSAEENPRSMLEEYIPSWVEQPNDPRPMWARTLAGLLALVSDTMSVEDFRLRCLERKANGEYAPPTRNTIWLRLHGQRTRLRLDQYEAMARAYGVPVYVLTTMTPEDARAWVKANHPHIDASSGGTPSSHFSSVQNTLDIAA